MKILFLFSSTMFICVLTACNGSSSSRSATSKDSIGVTSANHPVMDNGTLSKLGLPLSSNQEVPVNNSTATGSMDISYSKENHFLKYTVRWDGLTDKPLMAHIHGTAAKGVNAGVRHDLTNVLTKATSGSFTDSVIVDGNMLKEDSLIKGFYYINIHTPANQGGEIRGQIEF